MSRVDLLREIEQIVNGIPAVTTNLIVDYYSQVSSGKKSSAPSSASSPVSSPVLSAVALSYPHDTTIPLKKNQVSDYLITIGKKNDVINMKTGNPITNFQNITFKKDDGSKEYANRIYFENTNIRDLIGVPLQKIGLGLRFKNEPNIKLKIGRVYLLKNSQHFKNMVNM
jgi:hypothetical protein